MVKHDAKISSKAVRTGVQAGTFPGIEAKLEEAGDDIQDEPDEMDLPEGKQNKDLDNAYE